MEHIEIVNEFSGKPTGVVLPRHEVIAKEAWCRSTNVYTLNHRGEVLCHQRSLTKERLPGVWSTHLGGHVGMDETYESNALKELEEEAGIAVPAKKLIAWRTTKHEGARLWIREFVVVYDVDASQLVPQPGEVERFKWMNINEILESEAKDPEQWCAGTHDLASEYGCMLSAIGVAHHLGHYEVPDALHTWTPVWMGAGA